MRMVLALLKPSHSAVPSRGSGPANTNANGILEPDEYLPDLNRDEGVWYRGEDNFDNRSDAERIDNGHACRVVLRLVTRPASPTGPTCPCRPRHRPTIGRI